MAFNRAKAERSNGFRVASTTLSIIAGLTAIGLVLHMHYPQETKASRPSDAYLWFAHERVEQRPGTVLAEGLPLMRYPGVTHPQTNPVTIEQWGLSHHARGDSRVAIRAANWLVAHQRSDGAWTYNFDFYSEPTAEMMRAPWISGLAQGEGLSLLTRAYRLSGDEKYLTSARTALGPFTKTVEHGGVLRYWHGHPFYEEYPATKPSLVLNGFLSTLIGLKEFADETGDPLAERLWTEGKQLLRL